MSILLALIYLRTEPRRYTAVARMTVTNPGSRLSGDGADTQQVSNFLSTQGEKILSREILALALAQPADAGGSQQIVRDLSTFKDDPDEAPLVIMKSNTTVTPGKKDDALSVGFESPVKDEAPVIANAIVRAFMKYQSLPKQSTTLKVLDATRDKKKEIEGQLNAIQTQMGNLEQQYGALSKGGDDTVAMGELKMISNQLTAAHQELLKARSDYDDAARLAPAAPATNGAQTMITADDEQTLRAELQQLQAKAEDMRSHYLPDHPAVRALQKKLDQTAAAYAQAVKRRYDRAKAAEDDLLAQFAAQEKKANEVSAKAAEFARLKDDADQKRRLIDTLDTRIHGIELQQSAGAVDIDFFDPADVSSARKTHPSTSRALGLALLLGLLVGCTLAATRDWMDDRLHSADEVKHALSMPLLGAVPQFASGFDPAIAGQIVVIEPASEIAESYRSIRTAIYFGAPKDRNKTILITSPTAGDGKSTSAANIATVMAQAGKKVLLVDADLRNPRLHSIFNLKDNRVGLSSLLNGQGTWERAIQRAPIDGLDLLSSGPKPKNPSEMLNSPMFSELLEMLAEKYDQVIIDSPPVMGLGDARIIAASTDVTILVLRADTSTRKLALLARDGLAGVGAHMLGVIVNHVSRREKSHFGGAYGYTIHDGEAEENDNSAPAAAPPTDIVARPKKGNA